MLDDIPEPFRSGLSAKESRPNITTRESQSRGRLSDLIFLTLVFMLLQE